MKVHLLSSDDDFNAETPLVWNGQTLIEDLGLDPLFDAMADGDDFIRTISRAAVLSPLTVPSAIQFRQEALRDALQRPDIVRRLYRITGEIIERKRTSWYSIFSRSPSSILHNSIRLMEIYLGGLRDMRELAESYGADFRSKAFRDMFAMLRAELHEDYLRTVREHLKVLEFDRGVLIAAQLGEGNKGREYTLRKLEKEEGWLRQLFGNRVEAYHFQIADRDEAGARALSDLKDRGIHLAANALAQSCDHIMSFLTALRTETAFYVGCLNLGDHLRGIRGPLNFPTAHSIGSRRRSFTGLYDICLALRVNGGVVANDLDANDKDFAIVTGANQGGKSTFLRSVGIAQLMMQCGMFVAARRYDASVHTHVFTHYKREEDTTMESGKFDEELKRMNEIVNRLSPESLVLLNESFSATNDREGSEIAFQISAALREFKTSMIYVTHLFPFAQRVYAQNDAGSISLRAERKSDGVRSFKITEGEPRETSFGEDLYQRIFRKTEPALESR
jgi:MutS domain V